MGSQPWLYAVPYQPDVQGALDALKEREFRAGRYYPAIRDITASYVHPEGMKGPGAKHGSIEEALENSEDAGTQTVLDMIAVSDEPGFQLVTRVPDELLRALYGTNQPTREMVDENPEFLADIGRGEGVWLTLYRDGHPHELMFGGYSMD